MENTFFYSSYWTVPSFSSFWEDKPQIKIHMDIYEMFHVPNGEDFGCILTFVSQGSQDLPCKKFGIRYKNVTRI